LISPLRIAGIVFALLVLASLISRRRRAVLLGRIESLGWPISAGLLLVSVWPDAANILTAGEPFARQAIPDGFARLLRALAVLD
jgi:hypothetical protein